LKISINKVDSHSCLGHMSHHLFSVQLVYGMLLVISVYIIV
jgi:hypothetical protein